MWGLHPIIYCELILFLVNVDLSIHLTPDYGNYFPKKNPLKINPCYSPIKLTLRVSKLLTPCLCCTLLDKLPTLYDIFEFIFSYLTIVF